MVEVVIEDATVLHLNYSGIKELSENDCITERFKKAQFLYLKRNLLKTLPRNFNQLCFLRQLHLEGNSLEYLPRELGDLKWLQVLNVISNNLTHLPISVGNLEALRKLQIANNSLCCLPTELGNLHHLETLEASRNKLTSVPISLEKCSDLKILALDKNNLKIFPRQLCKLKKLTDLSLAGNLLEYLPPMIFEEMSALNLLVIDQNPGIYALPPKPGHCTVSHFGLSVKEVVISDRFKRLKIGGQLITMPEEIEEYCKPSESAVPCLQELMLRKVYSSLNCDFDVLKQLIPSDLQDRLKYPTCRCLHCKKMLFRSAFPVVYSSENGSTLTSAFCCSVWCIEHHDFSNIKRLYP